jgi:signal transduction histidine kinase
MPEDVNGLPLEIQTMTTDAKRVLWASILGHGTFRLDGDRWTRFKAPDADHFAVLSMMRDHKGRLWQGFVHNNVAIVTGDTTKTLGPRDGVAAGNILAITERGDHVWLGGTEGLSYYRNGAVRSILSCGEESIRGVNGIVESADGNLWLNQASGVIFISRDEISQAFADPRHRVVVRLYNYLDGLTGTPVQLRPLPTAIATEDGRIYFAARHELTWIDPAHIAGNAIAPTAVVDQLVADGHEYLAPSGITLEKGIQNLRFDYTASSLLIPQRVHFRYMLEGFDKSWQDAGIRRQAFYSKIPPGHYTFRLMASNNDGVWSPVAAMAPLYLPPTFRQSRYFAALLAAVTATFLLLLHKLRLRYATNQVRTRLLERLRERERIAQDLHDTFFQSIQVLLLRFYTVTKQLPKDDPARRSYESALKQSEQVMKEGRELLLELRSEPSREMPHHTTFQQMVEELRPNTTASLMFETEGRPRELAADPGREAIKIAREALANAIRHSGASRIEVLLAFGKTHLRVIVRDDGTGIPAEVLHKGHREGHLGMIGMRERARQLGARIEVRKNLAGGTAVELLVPAAVIYLTESMSHKRTSHFDPLKF